MILQTANLSETGARFAGEEPADVFAWPDDGSEIVHPAGPLQWRFTAKRFGMELFIEGRAAARFEGLCPRCAKPLADGPCKCGDSRGAGAWDALDKLITQDPSTHKKPEPCHGRTQTQKVQDAHSHAPRPEKGRNRQHDRLQ